MPLKTKRWNDPSEADDGYRLLVCRFRPRGLAVKDETWRAWCSELAPSKELHADFYGKNGAAITWEQFSDRYLKEMQEQMELIEELAAMVGEGKTITVLCSSACTDEAHCHRTLLKGLIEHRVGTAMAEA